LKYLEAKLGISMGQTTPDGLFTLQQSECLGACADSPVMLVNDRSMCSFMTPDKAGSVGGWLACGRRPMMNAQQILNQFRSAGVETCFHDRHIEPQILAGLNGTNWHLKDYESPGVPGFAQMLGVDGGAGMTQDQVIATVKESAFVGVVVLAFPRV
jgi:(2Fe-2S) ferredoxin